MFKTQALYQDDIRWKDVRLGDSSVTIGKWGGLLTCITMMLNGIGYHETPNNVNAKLRKADGFLKALLGPPYVAYVWPNCVYRGITRCEKSRAPIKRIDEAVAAGKPVILQVDSSERTGLQTHFVLVKEKRGGDYLVYDPHRDKGDSSDKEVLLTQRYKHNGARIESEISAVLWFDFDKSELPEPPTVTRVSPPRKADILTLYAAEERLVLRAAPSRNGYPWKCLFRGTELTCLESKEAALAKVGVKRKWIHVQDPTGEQGYVSAFFVTSDLASLLPPVEADAQPLRKKWCLKKVSVRQPLIEMRRYSDGELLSPAHKPVKSFHTLPENTVVSALKSDKTMAGLVKIMYEETYRDSGVKDWVTARVIGWVHEADLDDYHEDEREEFQRAVVGIRREHQTESSTDGQQDFYLEGNKSKPRYNMCGELCIASLAGKDIDVVLKEWKVEGDPTQFTREQKESRAMYDRMVGNVDKPLEPGHIEHLLRQQIDPTPGKQSWRRYPEVKQEEGKTTVEKISFAAARKVKPLADAEDTVTVIDKRSASDELQRELQDYFFITNVRIDTTTGDLKSISTGERNHWIVLDQITRGGSRVELYNPFPNRRQEYTFGEFYDSIGGDPKVGWWIKRDHPNVARQTVRRTPSKRPPPAEDDFQPPMFQVAIDNRSDRLDDAEQYMRIRGDGNRHKTNLCGEFSVSFILSQSLDTAFKRWQERLKKEGRQPETWELAALLQAYGFNRRKYFKPELQKDVPLDRQKYYVAPNARPDIPADGEQYFKSFSIDTVLEYWKGVQPDLYNSLLGDGRNEPTGPDDLITILKAYGYTREDFSYYRPGSQEVFGYAPSRDAEVIGKTHYLLAGVNISGRTGRLQPSGVAHWVVVTKLTPRGNLRGSNGGWVELYNPFPNCWEEYSYREFMEAFRGMSEGTTLWIKKDVTPVFAPQNLAAAKGNEKAAPKNQKARANPGRKVELKKEKERKNEGQKARGKKGGKLQEFDNEAPLDAGQVVCEQWRVKAIPWEIGKWVGDMAEGDRFFAEELAAALLECGVVSIQEEGPEEKKTRIAVLTDPGFSNALDAAIEKSIEGPAFSPADPGLRVARVAVPLFAAQAIEGLKAARERMPVHAYQPRAEFRAWTRGLISQVADPLETTIKEKLNRLPVAIKDCAEGFTVCRVILTRFTSGAVEEEIRNIWRDAALREQILKGWDLNRGEALSSDTVPAPVREWLLTLAETPRKNMYRVKRWGMQGMSGLEFDISVLHKRGQTSNFQAVGLYNEATGFGAIANYLVIPPEDVRRLEELQIEDEFEKKREHWLRQKMTWLCQHRGSQYMFADEDNFKGDWEWRRPDGIRWGPIGLGGSLVEVVEEDWLKVKLPAREGDENVKMAKLKGFRSTDWGRPLDQLLAEGLVHRCFCVYSGNDIGDSPQGIVYSPFWAPLDWEFMPKSDARPPTAFWIPFAYLENESIEETIRPL